MILRIVRGYDDWRGQARALLGRRVAPDAVLWQDDGAPQATLPLGADQRGEAVHIAGERSGTASAGDQTSPARATQGDLRVPRAFLELARLAACHRDPRRWALLYRLLWRIVHEDRRLLEIESDPDVHACRQLAAQVRRDEHKMRAFVRFSPVVDGGTTRYVAWYAPDHQIVRMAAPFFADRFSGMSWSILTPDESVHWDGTQLTFSEGVPVPLRVHEGDIEVLWRTYYESVFNPARVNLAATMREMPRRRWAQLPEARLIPSLVSSAHERVQALGAHASPASARQFVPATRDITALRDAAPGCRGCALHERATQVVFGEGPAGARLVLVGEQPGDQEDRSGRPFVGPAGEVLDRALAAAGLDRRTLYVTNAVKHFSFEPRGKRRIHQTPRLSEIRACRPWLEAELQAIRPECLVLLGSTAATALLGPQTRVMASRGRAIAGTAWASTVFVTIHPSAVLRAEDGEQYFQMLVADLRQAAACAEAAAPGAPA